MAINLNSIIAKFLTPEVVAQIASFLGMDKTSAQKAAAAAIPTILAGLSDLVEKPAGAGQLSKLLSQQQGGSFADLLRLSEVLQPCPPLIRLNGQALSRDHGRDRHSKCHAVHLPA